MPDPVSPIESAIAIASDPRYRAVVAAAASGLRAWRGERVPHRPADPGDFGAGRYYTTSAARARAHGGRSGLLQRVTLTFGNPLVIGVADAYDLAEHYGTIHGSPDRRLEAARRMTLDIRANGFDGLIAVHPRRTGAASHAELEIVAHG